MGDTSASIPDRDMVELSGKVVYEQRANDKGKSVNSVKVNGNDYRVVKRSFDQHPSGLDYIVVENEYGVRAMVFEGTHGNQDILTDAKLVGSGTPEQYRDALAEFRRMDKRYHVSVVGGNSLGGGLANWVAVHDKRVRSVTLDPAVIPSGGWRSSDRYDGRIVNYCGRYDLLTSVERAAGLGWRLPGETRKVSFGVPYFNLLDSNHTGYGPAGYPGADDLIPVSVFTGRPVSGHRIRLDVGDVEGLSGHLEESTGDAGRRASSYLGSAVGLVLGEGAGYSPRVDGLEQVFPQILQSCPGGPMLLGMGGLDEAAERAWREQTSVNRIVSGFPILGGVVGMLPYSLGSLHKSFIDAMGGVKLPRGDFEVLLRDVDDGFVDDAMVDKLKAYYRVLGDNRATVDAQLQGFSRRAGAIGRQIAEADRQRALERVMKGIAPVPSFERKRLRESNAIDKVMADKQRILDRNWRMFLRKSIPPILEFVNFVGTCALAVQPLVNMVLGGLLVDSVVDWFQKAFGNDSRDQLDDIRDQLNELSEWLRTVLDAVRLVDTHLLDVVKDFKPYIDMAIFQGTALGEVMELTQRARNEYGMVGQVYADIVLQLGQYEAASLDSLADDAGLLRANLERLDGQLAKCSFC